MKINSIIITVAFTAALGFVSVINIAQPQKGFSPSENRFLAAFPIISKENVLNGKFTTGFEKYASDQFVGRDSLISVNVINQLALGNKDINGVYFGQDGYLLEKVDTVDEEVLDKNANYLKKFLEDVKKNSEIKSAVSIIVPTASFVLQDKLPANATVYNQQNIIDNSTIKVYESLLNSKNDYIFYRLDHHWTTDGAFIAYKQYCRYIGVKEPLKEDYVIEAVSKNFYGTIYSKVQLPWAIPDVIQKYTLKNKGQYKVTYDLKDVTDSLYADKFLEERDQYSYFLNGNNGIVEIETDNKNGRKLLIIKDSFANAFIPFLARDFEKITVIDYRYYNQGAQSLIMQEKITDVIVLYNAINFAKDKDFYKIGKIQ